MATLVILDLHATFDAVGHRILCRQLQVLTFGLHAPVLTWFLPNRLQSVLNAAALSIVGLCCSAHLTIHHRHHCQLPMATSTEPIKFKLAATV